MVAATASHCFAYDPADNKYRCTRCGKELDSDEMKQTRRGLNSDEFGVCLGASPAQPALAAKSIIDAALEDMIPNVENMSLVEFAEFKGYKLGPWMKQQLQEIDEAGQRGLPDKG